MGGSGTSSSGSIASILAGFATHTNQEALPPKALDYSAMLISSTIASAALGFNLGSSRIARTFLLERGGSEESTVWFAGARRLPVAFAARANALASDSAASDDSDLRNIVHPGTTLAAAAVAMAEKTGATGMDILSAIALGYEVAGRINTGVVPGLIWEKGFHGCMIAIFGGAVAAGRLMKLDHRQMTQALSLAATSIAGLLAAASTSTAREHHAGLAAQLGVEAAQLAGLGYTAEENVFDHPRGFFGVYGIDAHASGRVAQVTQGLGDSWIILTEMAIKLVPGGHPYHAYAEAAALASIKADVPASEITAIICSRPNLRGFGGPRHPTDLIGVAHSEYYFAAAGAADRTFGWANVTPEKIMDPAIRRLLDLVEVGTEPLKDAERYKQGASVTIRTRDGRSFTGSVFAPRGSAINGIAWSDVEEKFEALCPFAGLAPERIRKLETMLRNFREAAHMRDLIALIG